MLRACFRQCSAQSNAAQPRDVAARCSHDTMVCISTATSQGVGHGMYLVYLLEKTEGLLKVDVLLFAIFEFGTLSTLAALTAVIVD